MTHTASRMNPPAEALAQVARDSKRAYERDWHVWSEQEITAYTIVWGVHRTVTEMVLNFQQLESAAGRNVSLENLGLLAQRIAAWGAEMCRGGQMFERERNHDLGE